MTVQILNKVTGQLETATIEVNDCNGQAKILKRPANNENNSIRSNSLEAEYYIVTIRPNSLEAEYYAVITDEGKEPLNEYLRRLR